MQARWGTHGDHWLIALTPASVPECFELTLRAYALSEKYRVPVVLLMDEVIGHMREKIEPCMQLIEYAKKAAENADIIPDVAPIRGGTDGARLSFKGLPCPNLGTGGYAFHGVYEHITVEGMDKAVMMVKDIVGMFAK